MNNDGARDRLTDVLAHLNDQLADIAGMQKAGCTHGQRPGRRRHVEVVVNARGQLVKAVIDGSYLADHDFDDLGNYVTEAAQTAAQDAAQRVAEMLAPINERHRLSPSFSDIVEGMRDPNDLMPPGLDALSRPAQPRGERARTRRPVTASSTRSLR